jgi:predicted TIM-barrel fold metal-dependent hydrolase
MYIVDSQIHIWRENSPEAPWASLDTGEHQVPSPTAEDLIRAMDDAGVSRAVLVPPSWEGDGNGLAIATAAAHPDRFGVMGRLDVRVPVSSKALAERREAGHLLGLRLTFARNGHRELLYDGTSDWVWEAAEEAGLPVMVFAPDGNAKLREIALAHPALKLVVDHVGLQHGMAIEDVVRAFESARILAPLPNVAVKASALPNFTNDGYPFRSLHEPIYSLVGDFGAERVFWGSDLTRLACPYDEAISLFTQELDRLTDAEREQIMGLGISAWLDWPPTTSISES